MQISAIILYGINGEKRILPFNIGSVNIITGKSKTGKSAIGDIIEYCFGGKSCNIADGFVREHVSWYALQLIHNGEYLIVAREKPSGTTTSKCCYLLGAKNIPDDLTNATPINVEGLEKIISTKLGISENTYDPPAYQSRRSISANVRHSLSYCLQSQDEIASQKILFHRQAETYVEQSIKDTLPYFLGIVGKNALSLKSERKQLKRKLKILSKTLEELKQLKGNGLDRATALLAEAREIGILSEDALVDMSDYQSIRNAMNMAYNWEPVINNAVTGIDHISMLQDQLEDVQKEIESIGVQIRNINEYLEQVNGYNIEINHQKNRLISIGLFEQIDFDPNHCPLCSKPVDTPLPCTQDILNSIQDLSNKLDNVSHESPYLIKYIDDLKNTRQNLIDVSHSLQVEINAIYDENKEALRIKDVNVRRGRVIGRIGLWLESVAFLDDAEKTKKQIKDMESRLKEINELLDANSEEKSLINQISNLVDQWAKDLDLEHSEYPYSFDPSKLTVIVNRDPPVTLQQLGSGSNWLGCHLITLFALHTVFIQNKRPVPRFLFLDQPSQVYFPPESNDKNVDSEEIRKIYDFIFKRVKELSPDMQVIIVDHADINEAYFQESVIEKWWDGKKLVPINWS